MCVCVCVYVCVYVCMYACMHAGMYVNVHLWGGKTSDEFVDADFIVAPCGGLENLTDLRCRAIRL